MSAPRPSRPGEETALRELWTAVFGDEGAFLDLFFSEIYRPGMARVMEAEGRIVSAAYALPFGEALYIYAVGTLPAFRGRGCGRAVTLAAAGGKPAYLCPASESLKRWYGESMGAVPADWRQPCALPEDAEPLAPAEFLSLRERMLEGVPHAAYSPALLRLFALDGSFYRSGGGRVFAAGSDGTVFEQLPSPSGGEPYLYALNGAPPLHWGITLE
ncbi:MAG: hypothetical protein IKO22_00735 [Oscillospiraceae bacterium]|nr:hypothetical protein [Oscillospiraceae bacterium]